MMKPGLQVIRRAVRGAVEMPDTAVSTVLHNHICSGLKVDRSVSERCNKYRDQCKYSPCSAVRNGCVGAHQQIWRGFSSTPGNDRQILRDTVRKFAEEEIRPLVNKMDEDGAMSPDIISSLFQQGFMGVEVNTKDGGSGMSFADTVIIIEELSRVDPSVAILAAVQNTLVINTLMKHGTEEQNAHYLSKLCSDTVGSFCLGESSRNNDASSVRCLAMRDDDRKGWVLNGTKKWIYNAKEADLFVVFATVDPEKKHEGIACFLVDSENEGLSISNKYDKLGLRASSTCEIILDQVFVPDNRVLAPMGEGYRVAMTTLNEGRIGIAAQMLGLAQGAYDAAMPYLLEFQNSGQQISQLQGLRLQAAKMATEIEAARLLVYNAAALKSSAQPLIKEAAMAKYKASRVAEEVANQVIEFFGSYGYTKGYPLEKFYRDAKVGSMYEGTTDIQLETVINSFAKEYS